MQDFDATFFSRISSGISVELKPMDLKGRISVLEAMFKSTGFGPGPEIISYIATRITQNIRTLKAAGRAVLANLLASPSRGGISLETVTSLLNSMNLMDPVRKNTETAAASSDNQQQQGEESPSPYIVVDIDDEENTAQESDEEKFKKALEEKRTDAAEERETAVSVDTETQENPAELGDEQETVTEKPVAEPKTHTREHTINVIESATTVTSQIEALKLAAERRITQLEEKNPNSPEIAKLRFAIVFLDQGKIESAMLALK